MVFSILNNFPKHSLKWPFFSLQGYNQAYVQSCVQGKLLMMFCAEKTKRRLIQNLNIGQKHKTLLQQGTIFVMILFSNPVNGSLRDFLQTKQF